MKYFGLFLLGLHTTTSLCSFTAVCRWRTPQSPVPSPSVPSACKVRPGIQPAVKTGDGECGPHSPHERRRSPVLHLYVQSTAPQVSLLPTFPRSITTWAGEFVNHVTLYQIVYHYNHYYPSQFSGRVYPNAPVGFPAPSPVNHTPSTPTMQGPPPYPAPSTPTDSGYYGSMPNVHGGGVPSPLSRPGVSTCTPHVTAWTSHVTACISHVTTCASHVTACILHFTM